MLSILIMWSAVQPVQIALRTLSTDGCSLGEQIKANAWAGIQINLAAVIANFAAFINLLPHARSLSQSKSSTFQGQSILAIIVLAITIGITWISVGDESADRKTYTPAARLSLAANLETLRTIFTGRSSQIRTVYFVQFFAWLGWFPFLYYSVTYIETLYMAGLQVQRGSPVYRQGTPKLGTLMLLLFSSAALLASMILPTLRSIRNTFTLRRIWVATQGLFGLLMLSASILTSTTGVILMFTFVGFSWAASIWIPFTLLGNQISCSSSTEEDTASLTAMQVLDHQHKLHEGEKAYEDEESSSQPGLIYGMHNFSICLPQILVTLVMGVYSMEYPLESSSVIEQGVYLAWVLRLGGICGIAAMYVAHTIQETPKNGHETMSEAWCNRVRLGENIPCDSY